MTVADEPAPERRDGRRARRDHNVEAVLDAVVAAWGEGDPSPEVAEVASRAGVSERSVFRYFPDIAALHRAAIARQIARVEELFLAPPQDGERASRIERFVDLRVRQYDVLGPVARIAFLRAPFEAQVRDEIARRRGQIRDQARILFAPELDALPAPEAAEVLAAIEIAASFEAFEYLRSALGLDPPAAGRVVHRAVTALLAAAD